MNGAPAGSLGTLAITSFGPSKPVALGAGGALLGPPELVTGTVARGDGRDRQLPRPPSPARFPAPLPAAPERADHLLWQRRAAVARFAADELAVAFRLPLAPPDSTAGWTRTPLYPLAPAACDTQAQVERLEARYGPVRHMQAAASVRTAHVPPERRTRGVRRGSYWVWCISRDPNQSSLSRTPGRAKK